MVAYRGFIKGRAPGKLTGCEHDFARLLYISKNFFLIQGTINNSFKLQLCPFLCPGVKLSCPPLQNLNEPPVHSNINHDSQCKKKI